METIDLDLLQRAIRRFDHYLWALQSIHSKQTGRTYESGHLLPPKITDEEMETINSWLEG